jgi:phage tail sheath protein FI
VSACHASPVSIEEIDVGLPSTQVVTSNATRALLEQWCVHELQWVACENYNGPSLWSQVRRHVRGYLGVLWLCGTLRGEQPGEAFIVTCDQTTMTPADIRDDTLICQIGVAPVTPSKFVFYRICIRLNARQRLLTCAVVGVKSLAPAI